LHRKTWAVVVMPRERWSSILGELDSLGVEVWPAETCHEARKLLEKRPRVEVVISDLSLADGNWCDVFKHLIDNDIHASMVVVSPQADERLWSEVLWRGAYDLLVEPYADIDVRRIVEGAIRATQGSAAVRTVGASSASALATVETAVAAS
jgi:DNA-binding NtrC family response regulator